MLALTDATLDFWLTTGRFSAQFEREFAAFMGVRFAHIVNSGSSANLLAFMALTASELGARQSRPSDEVIAVACAFPTTVSPILQYGAVPVFVDVTLPQYNIDVTKLEAALSERTKAVMLAHTLGNPFDIKAVKSFCERHGLWLIEDNCDALGSLYTLDGETRLTGAWGDIGTSSFYPPHHMTMGEGGCVYTNDPLLSRLVLSYRDWGRDCVCVSGQDNRCGHRFDGQFGTLPQGYDHKFDKVFRKLGTTPSEAKTLLWQLFKFGLVGLSNTLVAWICYYFILWIDEDLYILGTILGGIVSIANAFFWNDRFVFKGGKNDWKSKLKRLRKTYVSYGETSLLSTFLLWLEVQLGVSKVVAPIVNIPVVTYWNAIDLIEDEHPLYCGRGGNMGDRPGNWAVQNADLILAVGIRISIRQVGYNWKTWAREAEVIMVDIDRAEIPTLHVDMPIWADAKDFLTGLNRLAGEKLFTGESWLETCRRWKREYPVVTEKNRKENGETANVYAFIRCLSSRLPENSLTAVSNGACCVAGHQAYVIRKGSRFANNSAVASMCYGLPAAIGTCIGGGRQDTICLEGDGSIMMNLQELQTILTNRLPIKIFLINNSGYHSIRITQTNLFHKNFVGIGPESGDLSFPDYQKIAVAFGYPYFSARSNAEMMRVVDEVLKMNGPVFTEIFTDTEQVWEPKSSAKRLPDGTLVSPPLEDLAPFLPREELKKQMFIPMVDEG